MKKQAKNLGARVGNSITGKTNMLVCGEKVGPSKLQKAQELGVQIILEGDYLKMIEEEKGVVR